MSLRYSRDEKGSLTSSITIRPAKEMSNWWTMRKVGVQHPINHKRGIFVRGILRPNDKRTQQICSVLVCSHDD